VKLHQGPANEASYQEARINAYLDTMVAVNTVRADTLVDVTPDNVGMSALNTMLKTKRARVGEIDLRLGAYSPFGYSDSDPGRWELLVEGARRADFIGALPEADDTLDYPEKIGIDEHFKRMLLLGQELNKEVHMHTDQRNEPTEDGTERLIRAAREFGAPRSASGEPMVWAIHVISPSKYEESRFKKLLDGLLECNIGVVSCPSAAIGMRQLRPLLTPTGNSFPRLLEMLAAGVHIRIGCDNMADICSPSTTANLLDEVYTLTSAVRFYDIDILAKIAAGLKLDDHDRNVVKDHLHRNDLEIERILSRSRRAGRA
jgi:cytosine/adenosine deaminase-related metal-dependent hydrolase